MKLLKNRTTDEAGITLVELIVTMTIFGMVSIIMGNIFLTTNNTAASTATESSSLAALQIATERITKDVRNASAFVVSEDGHSVSITDQEGAAVEWRVTKDGFTNGSLKIEGVTEAKFGNHHRMLEYEMSAGKKTFKGSSLMRFGPSPTVVDTGAGVTAGTWENLPPEGDEGSIIIH